MAGKKNSFAIRLVITAVALIAFVVVGLVRSVVEYSDDLERLQAFNPHVMGYLAVADQEAAAGEGHVRGKIVIVDAKAREAHAWAQGQLPDELRADQPDDVGTVAVWASEWEHVGDYVDAETGARAGNAYRGRLRVTVVDWPAKTVVVERTFEGSEPVQRKRGDGDDRGGLPTWDALEFLTGLPRP